MNYTLRIPLESEALEQILADLTLDVAEVRPDLVIAWAQRALAAPEPTATQSRLKGSWSSS